MRVRGSNNEFLVKMHEVTEQTYMTGMIAQAKSNSLDESILEKLNLVNLILMKNNKLRIREPGHLDFDTVFIQKLRSLDDNPLPDRFTKEKDFISTVGEDGFKTVKIKVRPKTLVKREMTIRQKSLKKQHMLEALPALRLIKDNEITKVRIGTLEMPKFNITINNETDNQMRKLMETELRYNKVNQTTLRAIRLTGSVIIKL